MKKLPFLFISILLFPFISFAQMDVPSNGFNPGATISEEVGITSITIKYYRPGVKGREGKIWGGVVQNGFGNYNFIDGAMTSPWRAGANNATTIEFEHDVQVEGRVLPAGKYALFIAMEADAATLIFSKQTEAWGSFNYLESDDVLRVKVATEVLDQKVEWLKYEFVEHRKDGCTIALQWENRSIPFDIQVDVENIVMNRIREEFKGVKGFISANRIHASMYCFENNIHLEEALGWAQRAITGKPFGQTPFSTYENLVNGYEKLGRVAEADSVLLEALQIARIDQFTNYHKKLIEKGRPETAVKIMQTAQTRFGDTFAVTDGLHRAYAASGNYKEALGFAQKAIDQAPTEELKAELRQSIKGLKRKKGLN